MESVPEEDIAAGVPHPAAVAGEATFLTAQDASPPSASRQGQGLGNGTRRETHPEVLTDVSRLLQQPPDERLANLERFARCAVTRFRRRKVDQEEMDLRRLMPASLARSQDVWEYTACAICLADFADGEELRRTPCAGGHAFHPKCLRGWFERSHAACPVCRGGAEHEAAERRAVARPPGQPTADGMAEYVVRRMRSGKVDFTVSATNRKRATRVMRLLKEPNVQLRASTPEPEEERGKAEARVPKPTLPELLLVKMEAQKVERRAKSLCLTRS